MNVLSVQTTRVPISAEVRAEAVDVLGDEADRAVGPVAVTMGDGKQAVLPPALSRFVLDLIHTAASGATLTINALPEELSTTVAARLIGVSRPTLMKLIARGDLPSKKVGTHSRVPRAAVLEYREVRNARRSESIRALMDLDADLP